MVFVGTIIVHDAGRRCKHGKAGPGSVITSDAGVTAKAEREGGRGNQTDGAFVDGLGIHQLNI